jgi:hypothetical protein
MFTPHPCATRFCRRCYGDCDHFDSRCACPSGPETALRRSSSLHKKVDDDTALVRFAAGNFRIVPMELLKPATEAEAEEYYSSAET